MLQRTKGRVLLTLLVVTGLAGTLNNSAITNKERKISAALMKDTKAELVKSVKGLSESQLNFKQSPDRWSVKECVYHIAISEKLIWEKLEIAMKSPANPEKRAEIKATDEQVISMLQDRSNKIKTSERQEPKNTEFESIDAAIAEFKALRAEHIRYIKTTTEDLRNHVVQTPFGWVDCYQLSLVVGAHVNRHTQQLNEMKADPNFPR